MQILSNFPASLYQRFWQQSFLQGDTSLLMSMISHSQNTKINKFAIYLKYIKKEVKNRVHFLHADKHQSFYKLGLSFLMKAVRHVQSTQIGSW